MPEGLFFIDWDNQIGPVLKYSYPSELKIDNSKILQFLITLQSISASNIIQIQDEGQLYLIFGIPLKDKTTKEFNYSFLALKLKIDEKAYLDYYKLELSSLGLDLLNSSHQEKELKFKLLVEKLFQERKYKIVFMGLPNSGKTSTRHFFFKKMNHNEILNTSFMPTQGFENEEYFYLDISINLFDTSGQELNLWLDSNKYVLYDTDILIFFFSVEDWFNQKELVKKYLSAIRKINENEDIGKNISKIMVFCHKIDLLEKRQNRNNGINKSIDINKFKADIEKEINWPGLPIFFTSIKDGGNEELFLAFQFIISSYSRFFLKLINVLEPFIKNLELIPLFLLDEYNRLLINFQKFQIPKFKHPINDQKGVNDEKFQNNNNNSSDSTNEYILSLDNLYKLLPNFMIDRSSLNISKKKPPYIPGILIYSYNLKDFEENIELKGINQKHEDKKQNHHYYLNTLLIIDFREIANSIGYLVFKAPDNLNLTKIIEEYRMLLSKYKWIKKKQQNGK
ncbi:MAG: ADP-ribosylation factor-like protein [Promethearchaeota archaeon]